MKKKKSSVYFELKNQKKSLCFEELQTQNTFQFYNLHGKQSFFFLKKKKITFKENKIKLKTHPQQTVYSNCLETKSESRRRRRKKRI